MVPVFLVLLVSVSVLLLLVLVLVLVSLVMRRRVLGLAVEKRRRIGLEGWWWVRAGELLRC